ncbi:PASTA domain-containing protein [Mycolicibacterium sp. GCM10028919]|uniref:PASTA domain-containing protein n=1 Tax=Mycolicibacterium sp. GCM10028919 TaxID=3273401 RepID=UPI0036136F45
MSLLGSGCSTDVSGSARVASGVVPDVAGMTARDATIALHEAGPWPYVLRSEVSDTVRPGSIIAAGPPPGTTLPLNRVIDVVVSNGPVQGR